MADRRRSSSGGATSGRDGANPSLLTTCQVAKALGVSHQTVVNWANQGDLASSRTVGGHRRFLPTDVAAVARAKGLPLPASFLGSSMRTVLLVDDDEVLSDSVRQYFVERGGLYVEAAANWFEFGRAVERHAPDVIVLDVHLPGGDGVQVPKLLAKDPKSRHIPVIAWTTAESDDADLRVRRAEFADVVRKPAQLGELLRRVQTLLAA